VVDPGIDGRGGANGGSGGEAPQIQGSGGFAPSGGAGGRAPAGGPGGKAPQKLKPKNALDASRKAFW